MEEATPELNPELNNHYTPKPIPFVEKNGFSHAFMGIIWVIIAFVGFNLVGATVGAVGAFTIAPDITDIQAILESVAENFKFNLLGKYLWSSSCYVTRNTFNCKT